MIGILKKLEVDKIALANRNDFSIECAHKMFIESLLHELTVTDFVTTLNKLGVACNSKDVQLLVQRYDSSFDGKLGFWEFQNMFLPMDAASRSKLESRSLKEFGEMTCETRAMVIGVMGRHIDVEMMIHRIRHNIKQMGSSLREVFDEFDWLDRGYLTVSEIRRHFKGYADETQSYRMGGS